MSFRGQTIRQLELDGISAVRRLCLFSETVRHYEAAWKDRIAAARKNLRGLERIERKEKKLFLNVQSGKVGIPRDIHKLACGKLSNKHSSPAKADGEDAPAAGTTRSVIADLQERARQIAALHLVSPKTGFALFVKERHAAAVKKRDRTWLDADNSRRLALASSMWLSLNHDQRATYQGRVNRTQQDFLKSKRYLALKYTQKLKQNKNMRDYQRKGRIPLHSKQPRGITVKSATKQSMKGYAKFVWEQLQQQPPSGEQNLAARLAVLETRWTRMSTGARTRYG
jgi:hypothetical protein